MSDIESRFRYIPLEKATVPPPGLIHHMKDMWWMVHPEKGLVFFDKMMSPQCNSIESITRRLSAPYAWAEVRQIPSVFYSINPSDYCGCP